VKTPSPSVAPSRNRNLAKSAASEPIHVCGPGAEEAGQGRGEAVALGLDPAGEEVRWLFQFDGVGHVEGARSPGCLLLASGRGGEKIGFKVGDALVEEPFGVAGACEAFLEAAVVLGELADLGAGRGSR
jgi:hypothetical protein